MKRVAGGVHPSVTDTVRQRDHLIDADAGSLAVRYEEREGAPGAASGSEHHRPKGGAGMTPDQRDLAMIAAIVLPVMLTAHPRPRWAGGDDAISTSVNVARQIVELVKSETEP